MIAVTLVCAAFAGILPGQEHYLAGKEAERVGQYQEAIRWYSQCMEQDDALRPYAQIRIAICTARGGNGDTAISAFESALRELPDGPWMKMGQAAFAKFLADVRRHEQAVPYFQQALLGAPDIWFLYSLRWSAAASALQTSNPQARADAFAYLRGVSEETVIRQKRLDAAALLMQSDDPRDMLAAGFAYAKSRAFDQAAAIIPVVEPRVQHYIELRHRLAGLRGRVLLGQGKALEGHAILQQLAAATPPDPQAYSALADSVRYLLSAKCYDQVYSVIQFLQQNAPGSEALADAMWWRAANLAGEGAAGTAAEAYSAIHVACPQTERAARALHEAGGLLRAAGSWKQSTEAFLTLAREYPGSEYYGEAIYWAGVMLERLGEREAAVEIYGLVNDRHLANYYAHRACERRHELQEAGAPTFADLRAGGATSFVRPLLEATRDVPELDPVFAEHPAVQRLQLFGHHGFDEAEWEALFLMRNLENNPEGAQVLQAMAEAGVAYTAIQVAKALNWGMNEDGVATPERLRVLYPRAYWPEVLAISRETGVDPYLILAIAYHESTFRPGLTSHAGAQGLMQVMPGTAKYLLTIEPSVTEETIANLDSPINSLRLGAYYLMRMIERSDANYAFALASYNAGPGNLNKWRKARPNVDLHDFVEAIPFGETNKYVKKVLGTYAAYRSLYPAATP